jgi:hypothetical protein
MTFVTTSLKRKSVLAFFASSMFVWIHSSGKSIPAFCFVNAYGFFRWIETGKSFFLFRDNLNIHKEVDARFALCIAP